MNSVLPTLNAILNGSCALLLAIGFFSIRKDRVFAHKFFMVAAFVVSNVFLGSYLYYHAHHGATHFQGHGTARLIYFGILISHTILAVVIVPLVLRTLYLALRNRFDAHKSLAHWTLPLWLYVSVTGVVVYWMLYRMTWE